MKLNKKISVIFALSLCVHFAFSESFAEKFLSSNPNISSSKSTNTLNDSNDLNVENSKSTELEKTMSITAQLAMSRSDYPVTAGDVYTLAFASGTNLIKYSVPVDSTYKTRIANLGVINAKGLTYPDFKEQVIKLVQKNYPVGGVQFLLTTPSVFTVSVTGEVKSSYEKNITALVRLSAFLMDNLTDYSSLRSVSVTAEDGSEKKYDLFLAERNGDFSQDPFLRPGDKIKVNRIERKISLQGEVKRPGIYELLGGENLKSLIDVYGDGTTPESDLSRIELSRNISETASAGEKIYLAEKNYKEDFELICFDTIKISSYKELSPHIFVEGAVQDTTTTTTTTDAGSSKKISLYFDEGEDYAFFMRKNRSLLTEVSDLENAYIIRDGKRIELNLTPILYDSTYYAKVEMKNNDTLLIPFKQFFVSVSGAVYKPGRYAYIPDRTWDYYVGLAGGFLKEKNTGDAITITDVNGKKHKKSEFIQPEMRIEAKANSGLYYFNQYAPVVTTLLSAISTSISVLAVTGAFD